MEVYALIPQTHAMCLPSSAFVFCSGHGGSQELFIVASGVSQQHTRACAEAIKWQLEQKMEHVIDVRKPQSHHTASTTTITTSSSTVFPSSSAGSASATSSSDSDEGMDVFIGRRGSSPSQQHQQHSTAAVSSGAQTSVADSGTGGVPLPPVRLQVVGGAAADWSVLEAGRVGLHVLTAPARDYYALDLLWSRGDEGRVTRFKGDGSILTKDTIKHRER